MFELKKVTVSRLSKCYPFAAIINEKYEKKSETRRRIDSESLNS